MSLPIAWWAWNGVLHNSLMLLQGSHHIHYRACLPFCIIQCVYSPIMLSQNRVWKYELQFRNFHCLSQQWHHLQQFPFIMCEPCNTPGRVLVSGYDHALSIGQRGHVLITWWWCSFDHCKLDPEKYLNHTALQTLISSWCIAVYTVFHPTHNGLPLWPHSRW